MGIQILVTLFVLFALGRLGINYRERRLRGSVVILWVVLWLSVLTVFWSPEIASRLAVALGIGRGADLIVYTAIVVVVYLLYRIFVRLERLDGEITRLTQALALQGKNTHKRDSSDSER